MAFQIIRSDITKVAADAIVNSANPEPIYVSGTDLAIYRAAGAEELLAERTRIGKIERGQAAATPAFRLAAKYIIHTVAPTWIDGNHEEIETVMHCYENSLRLAAQLGCESIAFPLIATGVEGFPKAKALQIAVRVFSEFLTDHEMVIKLVVFDSASFVLSEKIFSGVDTYIDDNYVDGLMNVEYDANRICSKAQFERDEKTGEKRRRRKMAASIFHMHGLAGKINADDALQVDEALCEDLSEETDATFAPRKTASKKRSLEELMAHVDETWQESLLRLIDEKKFSDTEVYKRANVDRKLFSKIRCNVNYQPKKITAIAFALALRLNSDEARDFLRRAGYALSSSSRFDLIVEYFIENEVYDIYTINLALFDHEQPLLGA